MPESVLSKFNSTVVSFVSDLKTIFGENDKDIMAMEAMCDMMKINARLIIGTFQKYIVTNPDFVKHINEQNVDFFLELNFDTVVDPSAAGDYSNRLVAKFKEATVQHRNDADTIASIFNWFKVMIYYALLDDNKDPVAYIQQVCQSQASGASSVSVQAE